MPPPPVSPLILGALSGLLLAAGTAQLGAGPLCFVGLVPLLRAIDAGASVGRSAAAAGLAGLVFFGCALAWVPAAGFPAPVLGLVALYVCALAASWVPLGAALAWLRARDRVCFFAAAPLLWIAIEFARAQGPFGYPWHQLAYGLAEYPAFLQLAAYGGALAVSAHIVGVNAALAAAWRAGARARIAACALGVAPLGLAALPSPVERGVATVAAVQPRVTETAEGRRPRFDAHLRELIAHTDRALGHSEPDLVVWPEAAYEAAVLPAGDPFLGSLALHYGRPLLLGARRVTPGPSGAVFNSAVLARPDGTTRFAGDKVHPLPLYERAPESAFGRALARLGLWPGRFARGERAGLVDTAAGSVGVLMCFDSSFPELARDLRRRGARILVELSNEAQTGAWSARHHSRVSRLRAIETGLPLVRVSNSGPTEWVDARGRVHARIAAGHSGWESARVELGGAAPPYVRFGPSTAFIAALAPLVPITLRRRTRPRSQPD